MSRRGQAPEPVTFSKPVKPRRRTLASRRSEAREAITGGPVSVQTAGGEVQMGRLRVVDVRGGFCVEVYPPGALRPSHRVINPPAAHVRAPGRAGAPSGGMVTSVAEAVAAAGGCEREQGVRDRRGRSGRGRR